MAEQMRAYKILTLTTLAFMVCFAAWMMNGVLITFFVNNRMYNWDKSQVGWLIGIPVLTGSLMRLPAGLLTDKYGGRIVFTLLMLISAIPMFLVSYANRFGEFLLAGLGFGLAGASFTVGIAYVSLWFPQERQGMALGIFGAGNVGAALNSMAAPFILQIVTNKGFNPDGWRLLPKLYSCILVISALLFWLFTHTKKVKQIHELPLISRLSPLKHSRVWRFGLYYFFTFGGFVALTQWLIPYYVNVYSVSIASAGLLAAIFSLPASLIRAVGGWMSDKLGPRSILYFVFGSSIIILFCLFPPRVEIQTAGEGIMAKRAGTVREVFKDRITINEDVYQLSQMNPGYSQIRFGIHSSKEGFLIFPSSSSWQEPVVKAGDKVEKGALLAHGITRIYFQANIWIFTGFVCFLGLLMGIGNAAVFKHIPNYFPASVGVVGGIVGVLGGLGGFISPIIFGYLLKATGVWTTCWIFLEFIALICLIWMHMVIRRMMSANAPVLSRQIEDVHGHEK